MTAAAAAFMERALEQVRCLILLILQLVDE